MYVQSLLASNKMVLRFQVDLSKTVVPTGTTSDTTGLVLSTLSSIVPGAEILRVKLAGIKAVTAVSGIDTSAKLNAFLQKNGGNNVNIPSSGDLSLTATAGAIAVGSRDIELGEEAVTKIFVRHSGANLESLKLVLGVSSGAATTTAAAGIIEVLVEVEFTGSGLPRA
jgi:hypothetical protein